MPRSALLILGLGAWCFFRQSGLAPAACLLGGLAATLNSSFFSAACWGVASHTDHRRHDFLRPGRAGGHLLALALAARGAGRAGGGHGRNGGRGHWRVVQFVCRGVRHLSGLAGRRPAREEPRRRRGPAGAAWPSALPASPLRPSPDSLATEIKGVAGTQQDAQTKQERWDWATQWSLPKWETLSLVVPGLFGYRMDTPDGGEYWGAVGRSPAWDRYFQNGRQGSPPAGLLRLLGRRGLHRGACPAAGGLGGRAILASKGLRFQPASAQIALVLAGSQPRLTAVGLWPIRPLLPGDLCSAVLFDDSQPGQVPSCGLLLTVGLFAYGVDGLWRRYLRPAGVTVRASVDRIEGLVGQGDQVR